jgi:hypothetical protein
MVLLFLANSAPTMTREASQLETLVNWLALDYQPEAYNNTILY